MLSVLQQHNSQVTHCLKISLVHNILVDGVVHPMILLHWKEQVVHCKTMELENVPPKQKLLMLQNTASDVADLLKGK
jgi:hypothetical protein